MAYVTNMDTNIRVYNGKEDYVPTDSDLMPDGSAMDESVSNGFADLSQAAKQMLRTRKPIYHWKTKNKSFLILYNDLHKMGIKNNNFFLKLYDKDLATIDPYSPILPPDFQIKIILECMINPWYFLREICRIPEDGKPIEVGGGTHYLIDRNNLACWYLFLNGIDHYQSKPRQRGKTQDCVAKCNYAYHFGALASSILFFNKDLDMATKNLYRLKCQRDMLPVWMQMRSVLLDDGKVDRGTENVKTLRNPVTGNNITVMPKATSKDSAMKLGRGATAAIQYYDEFDFIPHNIEIINAASFAYSRAAENAKNNGSLYGRLYSSTPGDLDNRDGEAATEYISHMLKWEDSMLDIPIEQFRKIVYGKKRNGIVFVEHSWKQLKCSMQWYEDQCRLVSFNEEVILREIDLQRMHGSNQSPFKRADITYIQANKREPIQKLDLSNNLCPICIYERIKRSTPYILSIDPSEGLASDNNAFTLINPFTQKIAAEFQSPYISQPEMVSMCCKFMDEYCPKCLIVVENNRGREAINCFLNTRYKYQLYYDEGKLTDKVVEATDPYGSLKRAAYERRAFGFSTTGSSRPRLLAVLENLMAERKDLIDTQYMVDDVCGLIKKVNGRVEAGPGKHDDNMMSYMMGLFIYFNADYEFLEGFGIRRGASDPNHDYDENGQMTDESKKRKIRDLLPNLPDSIKGLFEQILKEKDPVQDIWEHEKQVAITESLTMDKLPSQMDEYERMQAVRGYGVTADPVDDAFWASFDKGIIESNFAQNTDIDIEAFLGEDNY